MPTWTVDFEAAALKQLNHLDRDLRARIMSKLDKLKTNPRSFGAIKMSGVHSWRIRVGDYRIIYEIHDNVLTVLVLKIGHRREIYR